LIILLKLASKYGILSQKDDKQKANIKNMFFSLRKSTFFGIDFGTSSIKAVELTLEKGNPKLLNYGEVDLTSIEKGAIPEGRSYDEEIVLYLRALLEKLHPKTDSVSVAMPAFIGLTALIEFPEMKQDELEEAVQFEAHKYIPSSLDDVALSWEIVGFKPRKNEQAPGEMEILLVAALKNEVARFQSYVEKAGMKMDFLELETFSLVRSIIGKKLGIYLIIDIGSRATNLVLVEDGLVKMTRNLDAGGKEITRSLCEGLNITPERAESLKKSNKDFLNFPESALVFPTLQMVSSEGLRMLEAYKIKNPEKKCSGVVLSGGAGQMSGLQTYYSKIFNLPVEQGNPWQRITYDPKKSPVETLGASFSVALGLALVGIDALTKKDPMKKKFSLKKLLAKKI